jgi:hypothetical protein
VVEGRILLTCVAVSTVTDPMRLRMRQYLKLLGLEIGLIANFHAAHLAPGGQLHLIQPLGVDSLYKGLHQQPKAEVDQWEGEHGQQPGYDPPGAVC